MCSYLPAVVDASQTAESLLAGTPAGPLVVRACDLRSRGRGTLTAGTGVPSAGEMAVFCRPVVTAPALPRRDGSVRAEGWLPDFVRLGELERHLGDGVIEALADAALEQGRLNRSHDHPFLTFGASPTSLRLGGYPASRIGYESGDHPPIDLGPAIPT